MIFNDNKKSFSIIGVVIAMQILVIGILAIISLASSAMMLAKTESNKIIAMGLAQEGMEIVRNIRDGNFLTGANWKASLDDGASYEVRYDVPALYSLASSVIKYDDTNFYSTISLNDTRFSRIIDMASGNDDGGEFINPKCTVSWSDSGKNYSVVLESKLYDWQKK